MPASSSGNRSSNTCGNTRKSWHPLRRPGTDCVVGHCPGVEIQYGPCFHFPLQRVLEWRQTRLDAERLQLLELKRDLAALLSAIDRIREDRAKAQRLTHESGDMTGSDLRSLAAYVLGTRGQERKLQVQCEDLDQRITHQLQRVLKARQDHHLLEKLRERRLVEWTRESDRAGPEGSR